MWSGYWYLFDVKHHGLSFTKIHWDSFSVQKSIFVPPVKIPNLAPRYLLSSMVWESQQDSQSTQSVCAVRYLINIYVFWRELVRVLSAASERLLANTDSPDADQYYAEIPHCISSWTLIASNLTIIGYGVDGLTEVHKTTIILCLCCTLFYIGVNM